MRKLAILFVVFSALTIASCCGNKTVDSASSCDTDTVTTIDTVNLDSMVCPD